MKLVTGCYLSLIPQRGMRALHTVMHALNALPGGVYGSMQQPQPQVMDDQLLQEYQLVVYSLVHQGHFTVPDEALDDKDALPIIRSVLKARRCEDITWKMLQSRSVRTCLAAVVQLRLTRDGGITLPRLPVSVIAELKKLRSLDTASWPELSVTEDDVTRLRHLPIKYLTCYATPQTQSMLQLPHVRALKVNNTRTGELRYIPDLTPLADKLTRLETDRYNNDSDWFEQINKLNRLQTPKITRTRLMGVPDSSNSFAHVGKRLTSLELHMWTSNAPWIRDILRSCTSLKSLDITIDKTLETPNQSAEAFSDVWQLKSLTKLRLDGDNLVCDNVRDICRCESLSELELVDISGPWQKHSDVLDGLKDQLVRLQTSYSHLSETTLHSICKFTKLEQLDISHNSRTISKALSAPGFSFGTVSKTLKQLCISSSDITTLPLHALQECPVLRMLNVSTNLLKDGSLRDIHTLPSLTELNVSNTSLSRTDFNALCKCTKLQKLDVSDNCIEAALVTADLSLLGETLVELNIANTDVSAVGLAVIRDKLPRLRRLVVGGEVLPARWLRAFNFGPLAQSLKEVVVTGERFRLTPEELAVLQEKLPGVLITRHVEH